MYNYNHAQTHGWHWVSLPLSHLICVIMKGTGPKCARIVVWLPSVHLRNNAWHAGRRFEIVFSEMKLSRTSALSRTMRSNLTLQITPCILYISNIEQALSWNVRKRNISVLLLYTVIQIAINVAICANFNQICRWQPTQILMVSCQKGPNRHDYAWQIGPFWQDTLDDIQLYVPKITKSQDTWQLFQIDSF